MKPIKTTDERLPDKPLLNDTQIKSINNAIIDTWDGEYAVMVWAEKSRGFKQFLSSVKLMYSDWDVTCNTLSTQSHHEMHKYDIIFKKKV